MGTCEVCRLTMGDTTQKPVLYCPVCDAWLCEECRGRLDLRAVAAIKRIYGRLFGEA